MSRSVHQGEITREAAAAESLSQRLLRDSAQQILILIKEALLRDGQVRIHNFGTFRLRWVKAHRGTNPRTGERIAVPAHPRALFTPAKALKEAVEAGRLPAPEQTDAAEPDPQYPAVAAARLKTPTMVRRDRSEPSGEDQGAVQAPGDSLPPTAGEEAAASRRPTLALAVVAVVALLLALLLFWPGGEERPRLAQAPDPTSEDVAAPAGAPTGERPPAEEDLSITYTQAGSAMEQVVTASSEPAVKPGPEAGEPQNAAAEKRDWAVGALDRPVRRAPGVTIADASPTSKTEGLATGDPAGTTTPAAGEASPAASPSRPIEPGPFFDGRDYRVASGDNLWDLSQEHYVRPYFWPHIYNANQQRIRDPDLILSGSTIRLPTLYGPPDDLTGRDRHSIAQGYFLLYRLFKRSSDPDAVFALSAVSHFDKSVLNEHEAEIQASHTLEVELAEVYGMRIGERIFLAGRNVRFPSRLFD